MKLLFQSYLIMSCCVCAWFGVAAYKGWKIPRPELSGGTGGSSSYVGRSFGGSWGGGK